MHGAYPLHIVFNHNGVRREMATGYRIAPKDFTGGALKPSHSLSSTILEMLNDIITLHHSLMRSGQYTNGAIVRDAYIASLQTDQVALLPYIRKVVQMHHTREQRRPGTIKNYTAMINHVANYLKYADLPADYGLHQVDYSFLNGFRIYLMEYRDIATGKVPMSKTTASRVMERLRTAYKEAVKEEVITKNPFDKIDLKRDRATDEHEYLTIEEMKRIDRLDLSHNRSLEDIRDIFLFNCYLGLRIGDLRKLRKDELQWNPDQRTYRVGKRTQKELTRVGNYLPKAALEYYHRFEDHRKRSDLALPVPHSYNDQLKVIGQMADIKKNMRSHLARHTCGMYLMEHGYSIEYIQQYLGHRDRRSTMVYARMNEKRMLMEHRKYDK